MTRRGVCNHPDTDGDRVGNVCDTCPFAPNPGQVMDGQAQDDDEDGDFVGVSCEAGPMCNVRRNARPFGFFNVAASGNCCTVALLKDETDGSNDLLVAGTCRQGETPSKFLADGSENCRPLEAPHPTDPCRNVPVRTVEDCMFEEEGGDFVCRQLPPQVAELPGVLEAPGGCEDALAQAGVTALENLQGQLTDVDFAGDLDALWQNLCFLPQVDQDFDGLGDPCDLCVFEFDPNNEPYIDSNGRLWVTDGRFCNGDYNIDDRCDCMEDPDDPTGGIDTEGGDAGGSSGGLDGGSSGG